MEYKIKQNTLNQKHKEQIFKEFSEHAISKTGIDGFNLDYTAFYIEDNGIIVGTIAVLEFWGQLHIKYLLVNKEYRGKGIGTLLMDQAIKFAKDIKSNFVCVETMSFQAPEFYQNLGFKVELKRDGYAANCSYYFLKKEI